MVLTATVEKTSQRLPLPQRKAPALTVGQQQSVLSSSPNLKTALANIQEENIDNALPAQPSLEKLTPMITFNLLHPRHMLPVQTWHIEATSTIKIGRSSKNEVTLYSTVVSRSHLKIERNGENWELVSFGFNGTFCDGKRITRTPLKNGMVIRLGNSGPQLQIWLDSLTEEKNEAVTKLLR